MYICVYRTTSASAAANNEYLAKIRKEEEEREAEWAKKYRDRVIMAYSDKDHLSINDIITRNHV